LWRDAHGDWEGALRIAQADASGDWVHAYLHRKQGDQDNAAYWYRRARRPFPLLSLEDEWAEIVQALLTSPP